MIPTPTATPHSTLDNLGSTLRRRRKERGLTLAELSARSQVSIAMLSHIERGQVSPSLQTLDRLRIALEVPFASFFEHDQAVPGDDRLVVRADRRPHLRIKGLGLSKDMLSPPGHSRLELLLLVLEPGGGSGQDPWTRNGEKAGLVLQGRFELTVGDRVCRLDEGDSFQFDSRKPHWFRNLAPMRSKILWIIAPDSPG